MGMYDSLLVDCPKCGKKLEFQCKAGECLLERYDLSNVPPHILVDIATGADSDSEFDLAYYWTKCDKCDIYVRLKLTARPEAEVQWQKADPVKSKRDCVSAR